MEIRAHHHFAVLALLALSACMAPDLTYRKAGETWASSVGYSDFELGSNKYKVSYSGGVGNDPSTVMRFAYQRAKELCAEKGFNDYAASNTESGNKISSIVRSFNGTVDTPHDTFMYSMDVECKNK